MADLNNPEYSIPDMDEQINSSRCSTAENVLNVSLNDKLEIKWGAVISQTRGGRLGEFQVDEYSYLLFVNRGKLSLNINDKPFIASEGQALVILPHELCIGTGAHEKPLMCQWLSILVRHSGRPGKKNVIRLPRITNVDDPVMVSELFRQVIEVFHRQQSSRPDSIVSDKRARLLLMSLLSWLEPVEPKESPASDALTFLAERARDHIRANCFKPYTITEVAEFLECSERYLREAFRRTYGYSPSKFMLNLRMQRARYFLVTTRLTINEVAEECGYSAHRYFDRVFARENGVTPREYRIAYSHQHVAGGI